MIGQLFLASAVASGAIIHDKMNVHERLAAISPHLSPAPGELVEVDPAVVHESRHAANPLLYKLHVTVNPPSGHCFLVTRNESVPDQRICTKRKIAVPVGDIAEDGSFTWRIRTGPGDFGHTYSWKTPHRIAQKIAAGSRKVVYVPVLSCRTDTDAAGRRIILQLMDGERWAMTFPNLDQHEDQPPLMPNLWVADNAPSGGISKNSSLKVNPHNPWQYANDVKPDDQVTRHWALHQRNKFSMDASNFKTTDTPPGIKGSCRYQFTGAPKDPQSGAIECHKTDKYDVVYTHLTCSGELQKAGN